MDVRRLVAGATPGPGPDPQRAYYLVTEDGRRIVTESGEQIVTEDAP